VTRHDDGDALPATPYVPQTIGDDDDPVLLVHTPFIDLGWWCVAAAWAFLRMDDESGATPSCGGADGRHLPAVRPGKPSRRP